jgi:hypothetical protein
MGPKGAVSKNFLYIKQHFSSTGLVGGKYISARTKEKKTLEFNFYNLFFLLLEKKLQISSPSSLLLRDNCGNVMHFFVLFFVFCSCFPGKKRVVAEFLQISSSSGSLFVHV